jgi:hypothetical protein
VTRARPALAATALVLAAAPSSADAATARSSARCITRLPVQHTFPTLIAPAFRTRIPIHLRTTGPTVRFVRAEIYTWEGEKLAEGSIRSPLRTTRTVRMRLLLGPMQAGRYTLVLTGEPNRDRSCGPKQRFRTVRFTECPTSLPIDFPNPPGGAASDYSDLLPISLRTRSGTIRSVRARVYSFSGEFFGEAGLPALFGTARLDVELTRRLDPGGYTVVVEGDAGIPRSCRAVVAKKVLTFS